jgi:hypothetical protein
MNPRVMIIQRKCDFGMAVLMEVYIPWASPATTAVFRPRHRTYRCCNPRAILNSQVGLYEFADIQLSRQKVRRTRSFFIARCDAERWIPS